MVIVNLGRKKETTHTGKKKSPDASTKTHSPCLTGLSASCFQSWRQQLPQQASAEQQGRDPLEHWGKRQIRGCWVAGEGGKAAWGIGGVQPQTVENVRLPGPQEAGLPYVRIGSRGVRETEHHECAQDRFCIYILGGFHWLFLSHLTLLLSLLSPFCLCC